MSGKNYPSGHLLWLCERAFLYNSAGPHSSYVGWSKVLDAGLQVDAVFLDFAKAFDRVNHKILQHKGRYVFYWGGGGWAGVFYNFFAKKVVALPLPGMD